MNSQEKEISYTSSNTYSTLNTLSNKTKNVWLVFHGMSYLSRYFLKYFKELNTDENYIIAPQAPSKFYIQPSFKHVGANWLTRENTITETENILSYIDAILAKENFPKNINLIVLGYSQGVSIAMRYIAKRKYKCNKLVLMSGGIPKELVKEDFEFFNAEVKHIYGIHDEYLDDKRMQYETKRIKELFQDKVEIIPFDGKHIVNVELIKNIV